MKSSIVTNKCKLCGIEFTKTLYVADYKQGYRAWFCSTSCANKYNAKKLSQKRMGSGNPMFGKKPWNYIDGKRKHKYAYKSWREYAKSLREKADYTCQMCLGHGYVVHHMIPWRNSLDDSEANLIILCRPCHSKVHTAIWRAQNDIC